MRGRTGLVMAVFAALVAGTAVIVYAFRPAETSVDAAQAQEGAAIEMSETEGASPKQESETATSKATPAQPGPGTGDAPKPLDAAPATEPDVLAPSEEGGAIYDLHTLPPEIKNTLEDIVVAAQGGDIEEMRAVLEQNELKPMLSSDPVGDPIAFWKKQSADGEGREVLAAMLNVFNSGFAKQGEGKDTTYVWPYFASMDLTKLTPSQQVELYRIVPVSDALVMQKAGKYTYYRAGIGADGVWHFFMK